MLKKKIETKEIYTISCFIEKVCSINIDKDERIQLDVCRFPDFMFFTSVVVVVLHIIMVDLKF